MKLKELRKQAGKTQVEVASFLGITQEKYSRLETGKTEIDANTLARLADLFHTTIDHVVGHQVPYLINKSEFTTEQLKAIDEIKKMDKARVEKLLAYIEGLKDRG